MQIFILGNNMKMVHEYNILRIMMVLLSAVTVVTFLCHFCQISILGKRIDG